MLNTPSKDKWLKLGTQRRAGILVPLFSIYSQNSIGIGDFGDLKLIIDFAVKSSNSIVQLLPMNEVGPLFCPYDSLSSFALEPMYISLRLLPLAKKSALQEKIENIKKNFPIGKPHVDYGIKKVKLDLLWEIYLEDEKQNSSEILRFKQENAYWLDDFALFKALKDFFSGKPWYEWEDKYKYRKAEALKEFSQDHKRDLEFQFWLQWVAYQQFREAKIYAQAKKILLMGDLPILVSKDSADVWIHSEFFKLEFSAGAPPDMYCAKGQRWGMPTYNWQQIANDDYKYLKEKLKYAENSYDLLRIDHVVGLFRIWSIPDTEPLENQGLNGSFDPPDEKKWKEQGKNLLSVILNSTKMLICAEDLGIIPEVCPQTLEELGIPGNDVQRWVKDWRLLSVAMLSNTDTANWPAWYEFEAKREEKEKLWRQLNLAGAMREKCDHQIIAAALKFTLESRSIFCIQLLIDWLYLTDIFKGNPYQYRINTPATVSKHNWSLVIPLSMEELLAHPVCQDIQAMIMASGRS